MSERTWNWYAPRRGEAGPPGAQRLSRRGVEHGWILRRGSQAENRNERATWDDSDPVFLRGALDVPSFKNEILRTRRSFRRFREGASLEGDVWRRLRNSRKFQAAGVSVDLGDTREIEKVHADRITRGDAQEDLFAKLSWISQDERDESLRVRFSFGSERLDDWSQDLDRAHAADDFCEAVFPESKLLSRCTPIRNRLAKWVGHRVRLSERIVFENAPGGGAVFHHDAETEQLGVFFGQISGATAWLALSKSRLARLVSEEARGTLAREVRTPGRALRALDRHDLPALDRLLNRSPRFTGRLVKEGCLYVLRAGDALLLPSQGPDENAWHSVFALGQRPSLAHSYGIFRAV